MFCRNRFWGFTTTKPICIRLGLAAILRERNLSASSRRLLDCQRWAYTPVHVRCELEHEVLGSTYDDAAGECFDKTAKLIGLPYPGGPEMGRLAAQGNPDAYAFPRPLIHDPNDDFSFSGLKTSVRYFLRDHPEILEDASKVRDLCASIQRAIVDVLVTKTMRAAERHRVGCVTGSGGVTCNHGLRDALSQACQKRGLKLRLADQALCTDNAAMVGILAERKFLKSQSVTPWNADILPGWPLESANQ